jgi:hypothetical protein
MKVNDGKILLLIWIYNHFIQWLKNTMVQKWLKYVYKSGRSDDILSALAKIMSGNWQ